MHRCAYDATGEKQWHDLAKKRFEVVGQNGVVVRSAESAPPLHHHPPLKLLLQTVTDGDNKVNVIGGGGVGVGGDGGGSCR